MYGPLSSPCPRDPGTRKDRLNLREDYNGDLDQVQ